MTYVEIIQNIENVLESTMFAALATSSANGVVDVCQMCLINNGLTLYFQTDKNFEKIENIKQNKLVAVNTGAYCFKGVASIVGHPLEHSEFIEKIKVKHLETYEKYTSISSEVLIKVELTECKIWSPKFYKSKNENFILFIDFVNHTFSEITINNK